MREESVVGVMDSSGNLVNGYVYDPFGNLFEQNETVANPWQYASGYLDSTTGLYHFGARYYDPTLGRWTQQDPVAGQLSNPDSLNPYLYVNDSPVNKTDTSGKDCLTDLILNLIALGITFIGGVYLLGAFSAAALAGATIAFGVWLSIVLLPIALAIGAYFVSEAISECLGYPPPFLPLF